MTPVSVPSLSDVLEIQLCGDGFSEIINFKAKVKVQEGSHLLKAKNRGFISQFGRNDCAAPIVVVPMKDKTSEAVWRLQNHTQHMLSFRGIPNVEDLFATLAGGKIFY